MDLEQCAVHVKITLSITHAMSIVFGFVLYDALHQPFCTHYTSTALRQTTIFGNDSAKKGFRVMATSNLSPNLPQIDEDSALNQKSAKQRVTEILDLLESKVEKLRKEATKIEEDKDNILASLDSVRNAEWIAELDNFEQDETQRYIDRIIDRCLTVDIKIHTQRDQPQEEALHQVNHLIDALVITLKTDPEAARERCISYMNACASHNVYGITDKKFENALLGCTLDDQKRVKKRLQGLLSYLEKLDVTCEDLARSTCADMSDELSF